MKLQDWAILGGSVYLIIRLCKAGKLPGWICNLFQGGIPGSTVGGAGGSVNIGAQDMDLAALILKFQQEGIGDQTIYSQIQPGDFVPRTVYRVGQTFTTVWGQKLQIVGYCRMFGAGNRPEFAYRTRDTSGQTYCTTADSFVKNAQYIQLQ